MFKSIQFFKNILNNEKSGLDTIKIDKDGVIHLDMDSEVTQEKFKNQIDKLKQFDTQLIAKS